MRAAEQRPTRPRRGNRRRLVRRSLRDAERHIATGDAFAAITYGRQAAMLIRHHFPAFYAAHVAQLSTSPPHLLGVVQAFFSLAQQRLWLDHSYELTINPNDPLAVLRPKLGNGEALARLEEFHGWGLDQVCPEVYGLPGDQEELFDEGRNLLVAVLWYLADRTSWSAATFEMEEVIDYWVDQLAITPERAALLDRLPHLDRSVDMGAFCTRLSAQPNQLPADLVHDLGQVVRYAFARTGNWFADLSVDELAEMDGSGIDWYDDLEAIAAKQAEARAVWEQYLTLNAYVTREPEGLATVVAALLAAAEPSAIDAPSPPAT